MCLSTCLCFCVFLFPCLFVFITVIWSVCGKGGEEPGGDGGHAVPHPGAGAAHQGARGECQPCSGAAQVLIPHPGAAHVHKPHPGAGATHQGSRGERQPCLGATQVLIPHPGAAQVLIPHPGAGAPHQGARGERHPCSGAAQVLKKLTYTNIYCIR